MKKHFPFLLLAAVTFAGWLLVHAAETAGPKPLRVLLVAGGCCHDYETQTMLLKAGIQSRINAVVEVDYNPDTSTETRFAIYEEATWADDYDVILHDECTANVTDADYVNRILDAHRKGVPAVNLHCAMHSYRWGDFREPVEAGADNAAWFEMIGLQSSGHGPQSPIDITYTDPAHPITKGLENWTTINEELYNNIRTFPSAHPLASGRQTQMPRRAKGEAADPNAQGVEVEAVVAWTNEFGAEKTRIFSTSIGHNNETVADDRYLDLVSRGLLWVTGRLQEDGTPAEGYGK